MQQPTSAATPSAATAAYAKVEKMDAEEARHLKAQYLIHKVLEEATASASARRATRRRPPALARMRARIGVRLKKLGLTIRGARARARRVVRRHLGSLRRLVARGGPGSSVRPAPAGPSS